MLGKGRSAAEGTSDVVRDAGLQLQGIKRHSEVASQVLRQYSATTPSGTRILSRRLLRSEFPAFRQGKRRFRGHVWQKNCLVGLFVAE